MSLSAVSLRLRVHIRAISWKGKYYLGYCCKAFLIKNNSRHRRERVTFTVRYPCLLLSDILFSHCVELEGVEPSSKQGNNMLSTCLFQTSFSCGSKTWTTNRRLSLIRFYRMPETDRRLSPIFLHRYIRRFGTRASERCLVPAPCAGIKPVIYCTSIRQRERNVFRQINL